MIHYSPLVAKFPWSSLGRREPFAQFEKKLTEQGERLALMANPPRISLVMPIPAGEFDLKKFRRGIESICSSPYQTWEVVIVCARKNEKAQTYIKNLNEARLTWVDAPGLVERDLKSRGIDLSRGEWIGFLEPDAVLSPAAFYHLAYEIQRSPETHLFYTNQATLSSDGKSVAHFLSKSEFSWFNLLHRNYIGRFWLAHRKCFSWEFSVSDHYEWDWLLRLVENKLQFRVVPFFHYYSERAVELGGSEGALPIVKGHLKRQNFDAVVTKSESVGDEVTVTPRIDAVRPKVSVVICFRGKVEWTEQSLRALLKQTAGIEVEIFLVNNQSTEAELSALKESLADISVKIHWENYPQAFNYADMHNRVFLKRARGDYFVFLNNDVFWEGAGSLKSMVAWAQKDWVGTVGIRLVYPDGRIQHTGLRASYGGESRLVRIGNGAENPARYFATREVFGNSFACCLVRAELFRKLGGLRVEDLPNGFGDVAFNLECRRLGYHNLNLGHLVATHVESGSRGMEYEYWEEFQVEQEFPEQLQKMLRYDLGFDRTPESDFPLRSLLRQAVGRGVREHFPWVIPVRPLIRKWLGV